MHPVLNVPQRCIQPTSIQLTGVEPRGQKGLVQHLKGFVDQQGVKVDLVDGGEGGCQQESRHGAGGQKSKGGWGSEGGGYQQEQTGGGGAGGKH